MNTDTGLFVESDRAPEGANHYTVGQAVTFDGDQYKVTKIVNIDGRGEITLRATSLEDRRLPPPPIEAPPRNRSERRARERSLRHAAKREMKR